MPRIKLPTERQIKDLSLPRRERKLSQQEYNALQPSERLDMIHRAKGKQKHDLLLTATDADQLVPQLHPQELYLTINDVGPEYAVELLMLADAGQITTLLDLDCWEQDSLSSVLSLHWLSLILETGREKVCQLAEQIEPEILALFLKKHLTILRGIEAYDDDDAENARRLESLYDIEYSSDDAAKIIGAFLLILAEDAQPSYLLLMEMVRSELTSVLEEEVFQDRNKRLCDLGFVPGHEARAIYAYQDPESFISGGKPKFSIEEEGFQNPGALLALAQPSSLLAEILANRASQSLATELCLLANRKMSADQTDLSSSREVRQALQSVYDTLNLALEYLSGQDIAQADQIFHSNYLLRLFQVGHSLLLKHQQRAKQLIKGPLGSYFDFPEQVFLDSLLENPPVLYRAADEDRPSDLQAIDCLKVLEQAERRLLQVENLQRLFLEELPFHPAPPEGETAEQLSLSGLLLTAVANQLLGRSFAPTPLQPKDLLQLKAKTIQNDRLAPGFENMIHSLVENFSLNCGAFVEFCLDCWQEDLRDLSPEKLIGFFPASLIIEN